MSHTSFVTALTPCVYNERGVRCERAARLIRTLAGFIACCRQRARSHTYLLVEKVVPLREVPKPPLQRQRPHLLRHLRRQRAHAKSGLHRELEAELVVVAEGVVVLEHLLELREDGFQRVDRVAAHRVAAAVPLGAREDAHRLAAHLPGDHQHDRIGRLDAEVAAEALQSLQANVVAVGVCAESSGGMR